ncbi:heme ABC exporter ATP-binding protein CcmA [Robiginitomaculum antarcticum]|uniref:heme ABC exporter ATP-binding protein CcmA n=1 Tax=Robiginitomaculum antarcticum TaxID=437507 RepID=UPI00037E7D56|nr:heme ABC exporter ATP-binding protein CcmA [Robiginitomaculum antarcticum]
MQFKRQKKGCNLTYKLTLDNCAIARGGRIILSGLSMTLKPGDFIWVTGENGVGKSSVLRLAAGILRPETGSVGFNQDSEDVPASQLVSLLSHEDGLHPALTSAEEMQVWMQSDDMWDALPAAFQLQQLRDRPIKTLSAGQRRRAAIARQIGSDKPIWLLDEPLSALDAEAREALMAAVTNHINSGGAAMIATHHVPSRISAGASILNLSAAR